MEKINKKKFDFLNLKNKNLQNKNLTGYSFKKTNLTNVNFKNSIIKYSDFWLANLSNANFTNADLSRSIFCDTKLSNTIFTNANLGESNLSHSDLKNTDFSTANLKSVNLRDAIYNNNTKWPKNFSPKKYGLKNVDKKEKVKKNLKTSKDKLIKKAVSALKTGKGYFVFKNVFKKKQIEKAENLIIKSVSKKIPRVKKRGIPKDKRLYQMWVYHLLKKHEVFREMAQPKIIMKIFEKLLGKDFICGGFLANCLLPGARGQEIHIDYPYMHMTKPGEKIMLDTKNSLLNCQILVMLSDFNKKNGATVLVKGTQNWKKYPTKKDLVKKKITNLCYKKGTVVIFNGLTWHASMPNFSNKHRTCILGQYLPHFIKPKFNELATLSKQTINKSSDLLKQLLGVNLKFPEIRK